MSKDSARGLRPLGVIEGPQDSYVYPQGGADRLFHAASVGKMFTAVLAARLINQGRLSLDSRIADYFGPDELAGLFVWQGRDEASQVTLGDLLSHRSGIADAMEDKSSDGGNYIDLLLSQPERFVQPWDILRFTQQKQRPFGPRGSFHYSDTGYTLIGLLLERVDGRPFHQQLHQEIFEPLHMRRSYMTLRSQPMDKSAPAFGPALIKGVDVSGFQSVSMDWAGGGVVSTAADLIRFQKALYAGDLLDLALLGRLQQAQSRLRPAIHYGHGFMELRFEGFFFALRGLPRLSGHIGMLSTHLHYDPRSKTHYVLSYADTRQMAHSIRRLITMVTA